MDYSNENIKSWDWQREGYCHQNEANRDISGYLWNGVPQNKEDLSYIFDETTPIKACGDLAYPVAPSDNMSKEPLECRETSSQVKRRRMLQFNNQPLGSSHSGEERSSAFLKSNETEDSISVEEIFPESSYLASILPGNEPAFDHESLDPSYEDWFKDCLNDTDMYLNPEDMSLSGTSDIQLDMTEAYGLAPEYEATEAQQRITRTPQKIVFRGRRKSLIQTPTKLATSVAYPFAFIKPSGAHGDVTLKEINQRIRTPPPSKSKEDNEDPTISYPTSAFSGKPVVGKMKIRTEGGKGSITIMRTKG